MAFFPFSPLSLTDSFLRGDFVNVLCSLRATVLFSFLLTQPESNATYDRSILFHSH